MIGLVLQIYMQSRFCLMYDVHGFCSQITLDWNTSEHCPVFTAVGWDHMAMASINGRLLNSAKAFTSKTALRPV